MPEANENLWAPWRMAYVEKLGDDTGGCFLCSYRDAPQRDAENGVLWRTPAALVLLNRFPYTTGHLMIAPGEHVAALDALSDNALAELARLIRDATRVLTAAFQPQGFNVGINVGRCAGAGLPDHVHWHVVPRWNGDTNFTSTVGGVRLMPMALESVRERLVARAAELGIGGVRA